MDALAYWLRAGCAWRLLPHDFPPWQTVHVSAQAGSQTSATACASNATARWPRDQRLSRG
ncbi:transposase [Streptomyces albireticuli]|uniref:transposase n=1 Tax=Streptomyces albireticuli TaxID=1940 RepID=UPI003AEF26BE